MDECADDGAGHGAMPAVMVQGAAECRIHGPTNEPIYSRVVRDHVLKGVRLTFDPEVAAALRVAADRAGGGFA